MQSVTASHDQLTIKNQTQITTQKGTTIVVVFCNDLLGDGRVLSLYEQFFDLVTFQSPWIRDGSRNYDILNQHTPWHSRCTCVDRGRYLPDGTGSIARKSFREETFRRRSSRVRSFDRWTRSLAQNPGSIRSFVRVHRYYSYGTLTLAGVTGFGRNCSSVAIIPGRKLFSNRGVRREN